MLKTWYNEELILKMTIPISNAIAYFRSNNAFSQLPFSQQKHFYTILIVGADGSVVRLVLSSLRAVVLRRFNSWSW